MMRWSDPRSLRHRFNSGGSLVVSSMSCLFLVADSSSSNTAHDPVSATCEISLHKALHCESASQLDEILMLQSQTGFLEFFLGVGWLINNGECLLNKSYIRFLI